MFSRSTINLVLVFVLFGAANSLKCQKCSVNEYHSECRAGTTTETEECSPSEDSCYLEFLYGPGNNYIPEYSRGCASSDWCDTQGEDNESDLQTCYTCQDDMCNDERMEDDIGPFYSGPLNCQICNENEYDSDCRLGKIEERSACQKDQNSCYVEYLIKDDKPHYIRGCANNDWCEKEKNKHGQDLKSCKTCEGHMCNKDRIGAADIDHLECFVCDAKEYGTRCTTGNDLQTVTCKSRGKGCYEYYLFDIIDGDILSRGCDYSDYCDKKRKKGGNSVEHCKVCDLDLCNNSHFKSAYKSILD